MRLTPREALALLAISKRTSRILLAAGRDAMDGVTSTGGALDRLDQLVAPIRGREDDADVMCACRAAASYLRAFPGTPIEAWHGLVDQLEDSYLQRPVSAPKKGRSL